MKFLHKIIFATALFLSSQFGYGQCPQPTNLVATYSNNVSTFSWDAIPNVTNYVFSIKFNYDPWVSAYTFNSSTNSVTLTGIMQSATYDWSVVTDCGNNVHSAASYSTYSTPCPTPSNGQISNITGTTAVLSWTPAPGYNTVTSNFAVAFRLAGSNNAWTSAGTTSSNSKTLTGLLASTSYEYCVNQRCAYGNSTPLIGTFTTAYVACNVPTSITINGTNATQASISWSAVGGSLINYNVEYKPTTATTWTSATAITNSIVLSNLQSATLYDVRVQAYCTLGNSSYIATQFTTLSATCPAWGSNSSEFIDYFNLGSINRTSVREIGGYMNTNQSTSLLRGGTYSGLMSAGYNPGIIFNENFAVYIDFNQNGSFSDAGERVVNPMLVTNGYSNYNFSISIPNNVPLGNTKMRVIIARSGTTISPCSFTNFKGEVEDYNVSIVNTLRMANPDNEIQQVDGLQDINNEVLIFPNPSNGEFTLQLPTNSDFSEYAVMNSTGSVIEKKKFTGTRAFIHLQDQPQGFYMLQLLSDEPSKSVVKKLIVVK